MKKVSSKVSRHRSQTQHSREFASRRPSDRDAVLAPTQIRDVPAHWLSDLSAVYLLCDVANKDRGAIFPVFCLYKAVTPGRESRSTK